MNAKKVELVQSSWQNVAPQAEEAMAIFYDRLFHVAPELKPMFRGDPREQQRKAAAMMNFIVRSLNRPDALLPGARALGERHVGYGVRDEHYDTVGQTLLWTLAKGLGPVFTPEVKQAWIAAYAVLSATMKDAAKAVA